MVAKQRKMEITKWPYCPVSASGTLKIAIFVLLEIVLCKTESQHIPFIRHYERVFYDHVTIRDHHVIRRSADDLTFQFWAFGRSFTPVLRQDDRHLHQNLVIETSKGIKTENRPLPYSGYIKEDHSSIKGVLTKGGHFEGKIITHNETYFMERTIHHFQHADEFHTLVYRISDVTFNSSHSSCAHARLKERQRQLTGSRYSSTANVKKYETGKTIDTVTSAGDKTRNYSRELNIENLENEKVQNKRVKRELDPTKRICELYMQADHKFYEKYGSNVDTVVEKLTQHVQAADGMYRNINFDGNGGADSIGFIIKRMKIWDDPGVEAYKYDGNFDVDYFLDLHSRDNYDAFCLSYMFTYQDFSDGVLGLAWVGHPTSAGGICETYKTYKGGESMGLNTGIVTLLNYGSHVPFAVSQVTFAHEIGHNFGSDHDPESDQECTPGETAGNYIMYARATSGKQENNFKLSKCSVEQIYPVLDVKASGTDGCFVADTGELCGNMVVESSEECDCGWEDQCTESCCNPMVDDPDAPGVETPCIRKSSAVCSPSEGICCDASCQYKNDSVACRPESDCLDEAICTYPFIAVCALKITKAPLLNMLLTGTSAGCPASSHKPNATTCDNSDDLLVCYNGECTGSICLVYGRESCQCSPDSPSNWKDEKLCQVCCMDGNTCKSSYELDDVPDAKSLAGQPCNDYQGYCDVFKICRQVSPEGPLSNLKALLFSGDAINAVKDFLVKHWYIGLIFGFVFIVTIVLVVKFCSKSHKPVDRDNGRHSNNTRAPKPNQVYPDSYM
ncbi:disintegrin and metalloproteinase domain-containing protein 10-like [Ruditapes philippinarum]|uniref:disintegrin and metalloproteinase domain-containing protein 10-like n=1 Tax=Ruditapes philippinarum TaxID=129788 RepID=UPI00295B407D|nr:disintegrin and metalloproteinase domain-containing protein 10-like [Ruditapes philippinarum]